ncbi:hypothetical protein BMS3Bbin06_00702 [bacterium BMS3Bbin06]|nr:hypothetical protein BMS3Abin08_01315 [bacterium BMS3Abin08]GBE34182.1 hypothetical protein BMS3Bbin06_00702 [bacterium BMS3Bbin06]HDY70074.1 hypothetical protein [Nitrospirota bacterium]
MEKLKGLGRIEDPVKKRAYFIGLLSEEIKKRGAKPPIVVGDEAVEIYTQGGYTTGDIDLKAPKNYLEEVLSEWNFLKKGRLWFNKEMDIYIDWLGETLDEGREAEERVNSIIVADGLTINVISVEDLIIDRLNAAKWWKDEDSFMWAKVLVRVKDAMGEAVDLEYLRKRAASEQIEELLDKVLKN